MRELDFEKSTYGKHSRQFRIGRPPHLPVTGFACPYPKVKETPALTSARSRAILGLLDILVDIGVLAEKEVIQ
jgi:hypothetical protein